MDVQTRIVELLARWQSASEHGTPLSLEELCRDCPELLERIRAEIEQLTGQSEQRTAAWQDTGTDSQVSTSREVPQVPGYEILSQLGRGGMGVVYKARQIGLNRVVALKMIRAGTSASAEELTRFLTEAEAVAALSHPNVVQIHEISANQELPYFSMEFVAGGSLSAKVRENPLSPREAAVLLKQIARGVQAAHDRGIIHRDLKPENVLLTPQGTPKVSDFGLAKKIEGGSNITHTAAVMGTPSYMSPEQAEGTKTIGPATDIWALGAILYRLVTGRPPFQAPTVLETLIQVKTAEPVAPSRLQPRLPRDIETICLKCLQKDEHKRYASAADLADDLKRWLSGEPILARPVGRVERSVKWIRRNPALASFMTALVLGIVGTSVGFVRADSAMDQAERARDQALKRLDQVKKGNELLTSIFTDVDVGEVKAGFDPLEAILARQLGKAAKNLEGEAVGDELVVAELQNRLGDSLVNLGHAREALPLLIKAHETDERKLGPDDPRTLTCMGDLGYCYLQAGELKLAVPLLEDTWKRRQDVSGSRHKDTLSAAENLAQAYQAAGRLGDALPLFDQTLKIRKETVGLSDRDTLKCMNNVAVCYRARGDLGRALDLWKEALPLMKSTLGKDNFYTLAVMTNLAEGYRIVGKFDLAIPLFEETLNLQRTRLGFDHPLALSTLDAMAECYRRSSKWELAMPLFEEALRLRKLRFGFDHPDTITSMNSIGVGYLQIGKVDLAIPQFEELLKVRRAKFGLDHPDTLAPVGNLAFCYGFVGRADLALALYQEAIAVLEKMQFRSQYANNIVNGMIGLYTDLKQFDAAEKWRRKWMALVKQRSGADSIAYAQEHIQLGEIYLQQDRWTEAEATLRDSLALYDKLKSLHWTKFLAQSLLGGALLGQKKYADAEPLIVQGYEGLKKHTDEIPLRPRYGIFIGAVERLVKVNEALHKPDEADKWRKILEKLPPPPKSASKK